MASSTSNRHATLPPRATAETPGESPPALRPSSSLLAQRTSLRPRPLALAPPPPPCSPSQPPCSSLSHPHPSPLQNDVRHRRAPHPHRPRSPQDRHPGRRLVGHDLGPHPGRHRLLLQAPQGPSPGLGACRWPPRQVLRGRQRLGQASPRCHLHPLHRRIRYRLSDAPQAPQERAPLDEYGHAVFGGDGIR